ncbi:hypothetical protein Patl1_24672 [Pistacia atlantica]|uniref:Uncharacterized protein n=1 Tax=Pistacia atlantica TaxID=434234 RepID=A0ACC1A1U6_9ROSI|nr:hypothetical protein Patl1_24672 [Pistacia atlantica]
MISLEKLAKIQGSQDSNDDKLVEEKSKNSPMKGGMVLPIEPLSIAFQDVKYHVDIPGEGQLFALPSIDIFEAFDEAIPRVPKIRDNYNPATWILELSSPSSEVDFPKYTQILLYMSTQSSCEGVEYSTSWFKRFAFSNPLHTKWLTAIPFLSMETELVLLEKSFIQIIPSSYSIFAFWCTDLGPRKGYVTVKLPYLCLQAIMYVIITYLMIGFYWSAYKVFWMFCAMYINMMYYNYLTMLVPALTPTHIVASILSSFFLHLIQYVSRIPHS